MKVTSIKSLRVSILLLVSALITVTAQAQNQNTKPQARPVQPQAPKAQPNPYQSQARPVQQQARPAQPQARRETNTPLDSAHRREQYNQSQKKQQCYDTSRGRKCM